MKTIDIRLDSHVRELLSNQIGHILKEYVCDPFIYSNSVYGVAGVYTDQAILRFTNLVEETDYYGSIEDVAIFKLERADESSGFSFIDDEHTIKNPMNKTISSIHIVDEQQRLFKGNELMYEVWVTRGVIFVLEDKTELSFEKNIWFSEDISIRKGENLLSMFSSTKEFEESWEGEYRGECNRELIILQ